MNFKNKLSLLGIIILALMLVGCETPVPKDVLKADHSVLQTRALQSRKFETTNENLLLSASVSALQDMGFTIDDSEIKLGTIVASKDADATNKAQIALATTGMVLGALSGSIDTRMYQNLDDVQKIRASLVAHQNTEQKNTVVRVTFQRLVWNKNKQISKRETLNDAKLYQGFYDRLSKAVFLEGHQI